MCSSIQEQLQGPSVHALSLLLSLQFPESWLLPNRLIMGILYLLYMFLTLCLYILEHGSSRNNGGDFSYSLWCIEREGKVLRVYIRNWPYQLPSDIPVSFEGLRDALSICLLLWPINRGATLEVCLESKNEGMYGWLSSG
ncbi:conserved hypothetical protein [Ricinus communis]|uniref:Uncharacterized protein n=1 Tax=Ricinus communis TaxID=3988 RepID=B9S191_RICCO|nr:conserved hypothetical protein [Ricinus communis]